MNWQLAANHRVALTPMSDEVNTRRYGGVQFSVIEIEHLIELRRQEGH